MSRDSPARTPPPPRPAADAGPSDTVARSHVPSSVPAYDRVEGSHLRQLVQRATLPLGVLCTNGAGPLDVPWLPRHDAPLRWLGVSDGTAAALATWLPWAGGGLVALAAVLRVLSKGVLVRRTEVTSGGVYARCRHPFYLAALLGGVGTLGIAGPLGWTCTLAWLALAWPVYDVTMRGEEAGLSRAHGEAWDAYAARTPRLLPLGRPRGPDAARLRVTWRNLRDEREPPRLLRVLGNAVLVAALLFAAPWWAAGVAAALLLHGVSHLLPGGRRSRRRART